MVTQVATDGALTGSTSDGKTETKQGDEINPALAILPHEGNHEVVKNKFEVDVTKTDEEKNDEAQTGDKRSAEETVEEKKAEEGGHAKKQKTEVNGEKTKKKGRPAKAANGAPKKDTKKRPAKKAATESGEPRRSGRNSTK